MAERLRKSPGDGASVVHLNVVGFQAALAAARDRSLRDRPFVIASPSAARAIVLDLSPRALSQGLWVGMPLAAAERQLPGLPVLSPSPPEAIAANRGMERIARLYAPLVQSEANGHLYLDLSGTSRLFGPYVDQAVRIRNEISEALGIEPAMSLASNKLVAKVGTRSIRPEGIACVRAGDEAAFLASQDVRLLPGVGRAVSRLLSVAGIREIGELAELSDTEALALFGKRGLSLRDAALGLDPEPVLEGDLGSRRIRRRLDFPEDVLDEGALLAALLSLTEDSGFELRKSLLAASRLTLAVTWADGGRTEASEKSRSGWTLDADLSSAARRAFRRAAERRLRIRGFSLLLEDLSPFAGADLFIPERLEKEGKVQAAVDKSRVRFGVASVTRASSLIGIPATEPVSAPSLPALYHA